MLDAFCIFSVFPDELSNFAIGFSYTLVFEKSKLRQPLIIGSVLSLSPHLIFRAPRMLVIYIRITVSNEMAWASPPIGCELSM